MIEKRKMRRETEREIQRKNRKIARRELEDSDEVKRALSHVANPSDATVLFFIFFPEKTGHAWWIKLERHPSNVYPAAQCTRADEGRRTITGCLLIESE